MNRRGFLGALLTAPLAGAAVALAAKKPGRFVGMVPELAMGFQPRTAAEVASNTVPFDYSYPSWDLRRYRKDDYMPGCARS